LGDPAAMTIELWFYVATNDKTLLTYFMDARIEGNWYLVQSYPAGSGNINFNNRVKLDPEDWSADQWNHLVVTVNSSQSAIYINGGLKATGTGMNPNIGANLKIGTRISNSINFRGDMDEVRIYETILGATIAVLTSLIFMPSHAKSNFKYQARNYVAQCKELIDKSFNIASHSENAIIITDLRDKLFKSLNQLSETYNTSTYEMLVTLVPRKEARQLLNNYSVLIHYVTSLLEASPFFHYQLLTEESKKQLKEVQHTLLQNISIIIYKFDQQNNEKSIESLDFKLDTLTESCLLALKTNNEVSAGTMHMISFIYYVRKINEVLLDLEKL